MNSSEFIIQEKEIGENEVCVGLATTPEEKIGRLNVVTDRYIREGYLQGIPFAKVDLDAKDVVEENGIGLLYDNLSEDLFDKFIKEGLLLRFNGGEQLYLDKYHWQSAQFVAKTRAGYVGSVRIIMTDEDSGLTNFPLPTLVEKGIKIDPEWRDKADKVKAELSQFAKTKEPYVPATVSIGLLRVAAKYSRANNIEEWVATTDNSVVKLLNGFMFNFDLPKIGPSVKYLGSESTPVLINIEQAIGNAEKKGSSEGIAKFLRGDDVSGFEWYTGV